MCNNACNFVVKVSLVALILCCFTGCERNGPSPVDIKIDDITTGTHTVSNNETLFDIAYRYNIDPMNLADINGIKPPYAVKNGQVLQLPDNNRPFSREITVASSGYTAIDSSIDSNNDNTAEEKQHSYEEVSNSDKEKKTEDIDEEFNSIIASSSGTVKKEEKNKREERDKKAKELATPKVTATVVGTPTSSKKESDKKEEKSGEQKSAVKNSKMRMPVKGRIISHYGDIVDGIANDGMNISAKQGDDVVAAADGKVIYVGNKLDEEYGNVIIIQHDNGLITSYAHLDNMNVKKDADVLAGDKIGTVGQTGDVDSPQLYFEVMKNKKPVNPSKYLKK